MSNATSTWNFTDTSATTTIHFMMPLLSDVYTTVAIPLIWQFCWKDDKGHFDLYPHEKSLPNGMPKGKLKDTNRFKPKTFLCERRVVDKRSSIRGFQGFHGNFRNG